MIGEHIRTLRASNNILLRQLADTLKIDTALLSKMERGKRCFRKEDVEILSTVFGESKEQLLTLWLADKILKTAKNEKFSKEALMLAIENVEPRTSI